ncbi:radical SAM protein [Carboxylicivirga caseinilyticus]|uniref:radical SAM protein n=1 Tax=Carboxylicivirga caseinilyticus TaxID=3417572 RepID=UPI003D3593E9|nr:radical SAM protein [Marinilabiliaceae bacterium A049]
MEFSKHNIFSKIADSDNYFIVNPLSGNADVLEPHEAKAFKEQSSDNLSEFIEKGYLVDLQKEEQLFKSKYLDFIDDRDEDEVQLFFTPWYACNFNCSYCFQDEYTNPNETVKNEVIDAFFKYVDHQFAHRRKYITIFGGEPLLNNAVKKESIERIISEANKRELDIAVVTNGYNLIDFIEALKKGRIREIQVTVDGTQEVHDARRMLRGGKGSFERISDGIDALLKNQIPVNLRMIIDKENVHNLPDFARYAIAKGWTKSPLFKTALGRNYELHHCQTNNKRLFSRIEMYQEIYKIIKENPETLEFHKPAFSISKFIFENGELPNPLFDSCTGTKTEWAFDYTGKIYSCTATVGNEGDELGTFYPEIQLNEEKIEEWEERDVLSITECSNCAVRLACGGGCTAIAKNRTGKINSPDCRPVQELLELGIGLYSEINI